MHNGLGRQTFNEHDKALIEQPAPSVQQSLEGSYRPGPTQPPTPSTLVGRVEALAHRVEELSLRHEQLQVNFEQAIKSLAEILTRQIGVNLNA